jgi:diguanylate cyclase (GGDEF)-like protein/PAS domain S-box-containing protein
VEPDYKVETKRLQAIIEGTRAGTWEWNVQTNEVIINARWAEIIGYELHELENRDTIEVWRELCHPNDLQVSDKCFEDYFDGKISHYECRIRLRHKEGHWVWIHDRGKIVTRTEDGLPEWTAGTHIDITNEYKTQVFLSKIAKSAPGIIYTFQITPDGKYSFPYVSDKCREYYGVGPDVVKDDASVIFDAIFEEDRLPLLQSIEDAYKNQTDWNFEYRILAKGNKMRWLYGHASFEKDEEDVSTWYGMIIDITEKKLLEQKLIELSTIDELTGLYNRREIINKLQETLNTKHRYSREYCLVLIDLDNFKSINDTLGHDLGDEALRSFAYVMRARLRKTDIFGRFGGEEFVIIMPETSQSDGYQICQELLSDFRELSFGKGTKNVIQPSFSAGLTIVTDEDQDISEVLRRADKAMYRAKAAGKAQICVNLVA